MVYQSLSIKEKIGQRLMFGVNSDNIDLIVDLIRDYAIGGVFYIRKIIVIITI